MTTATVPLVRGKDLQKGNEIEVTFTHRTSKVLVAQHTGHMGVDSILLRACNLEGGEILNVPMRVQVVDTCLVGKHTCYYVKKI